ncbi:MAG: V-type ATP synthase subunit E family protein [Sulfuricaulis sp.]|uniref:V-type ATP synthase subunit E n=1 Tax=Sulfuricaulis sp. TaxID=2003553 RepID=UPI0025DBF101|nr:V-type ATP synthase subunit E family protein [Sulfuricaulis sp.]MCR4347114.1 V-type ATP synthase subunit E family protein [Sulfuricaulis sp.]
MNKQAQINELEAALIARAKALADEHLANAGRARDQVLADANERQHLREEREILAAKATAERTFRQRQQAAEIKQQEEIDRLRWNLVQNVMSRLTAELERLGNDEKNYLPLLRKLLAQSAGVFEEKDLVAELNARDHARLSGDWESFCRDAGVKQRITLAPDPVVSLGGVRVRNASDTIRVDNSFEGRQERLQEALHQVVMERLFASTAPIGAIIGG